MVKFNFQKSKKSKQSTLSSSVKQSETFDRGCPAPRSERATIARYYIRDWWVTRNRSPNLLFINIHKAQGRTEKKRWIDRLPESRSGKNRNRDRQTGSEKDTPVSTDTVLMLDLVLIQAKSESFKDLPNVLTTLKDKLLDNQMSPNAGYQNSIWGLYSFYSWI